MRFLLLLLFSTSVFGQISSAPVLLGQKGPSDPTNCQEGQLFYNVTGHVTKVCYPANTWTAMGGGAATSIVIGNPVTGGGANRVLYEDGSQNLAASANLTFSPTGSLLTLGTDAVVSRYAAKQVMISGDGTGATTNAGLICGYYGVSGYGACWNSGLTPSTSNHTFYTGADGSVQLNAPSGGSVSISVASTAKLTVPNTAGSGPSITAGTATTDVAALSVTRTNNNSAVATGVKFAFTDTSSAAGFLPLQVLGGASAATSLFSVDKSGNLSLGGTTVQNSSGQLAVISATSTMSLQTSSGTNLVLSGGGASARALFGGSTSAFPALKRNNAELQSRLADDSAYANFDALGYKRGGAVTVSGTAPSIASGGCTSPAVTSNNGTAAFLLTVGTSCSGVKTMTLTMPSATNLWACTGNNNTSSGQQDANVLGFRATSATAVVITNYARTTGLQADFTASDTLLVSCTGN